MAFRRGRHAAGGGDDGLGDGSATGLRAIQTREYPRRMLVVIELRCGRTLVSSWGDLTFFHLVFRLPRCIILVGLYGGIEFFTSLFVDVRTRFYSIDYNGI